MNDIIKIVKSLEASGLLIEGIGETIKNEAKEQKRGVLGMWNFLRPPHPLANFETQKYYENEPKFNSVYSRNNLSKLKDGAYINHEKFRWKMFRRKNFRSKFSIFRSNISDNFSILKNEFYWWKKKGIV